MKKSKKSLLQLTKISVGVLLVMAFSCNSLKEYSPSDAAPISHSDFSDLLKTHVTANGSVDYQGFINDKADLKKYLNKLSSHPPNESWSREEKLAYWINAYNAFTVKLIIDNYPIESIQDLHPTIKIPTVSTVWHKKFFKIGKVQTSLNEIEHEILREKFDEPRIHFAINCASESCPILRNSAFSAKELDKQLDEQTQAFLSDTSKNKIAPNELELSKIFRWFKGDFTKNGSLIAYINQYTKVEIKSTASIDFMEYDWSLNEK